MINGHDVVGDLLDGLARLEYRGYDSAGIALLGEGGGIRRRRSAGALGALRATLDESPVDGRVGIGHTRWATHGAPTERNAHPHVTPKVAVVHNGIIENHVALRAALEARGARFESDTDTEVVPKMISELVELGLAPLQAVEAVADQLEGSFALGVIFADDPDRIIAARRGSPLAVARLPEGACLASDALALAPLSRDVLHLQDHELAELTREGVEIHGRSAASIAGAWHHLPSVACVGADKGCHEHFTRKEIFEQPEVLERVAAAYAPGAVRAAATELLEGARRLTIVACGTSFYAGSVARHWFESLARLPVDIDVASEFRYREPPLEDGGVALFVSQSGETADTLAALRYARAAGQRTVALVNVIESTIAKEADIALPLLAGPEVGVASTKAFTAQLAILGYLAVGAGLARRRLSQEDARRLRSELDEAGAAVRRALELEPEVMQAAAALHGSERVLFLGRGAAAGVALEGALKLKEISYVAAEGFAAGELKHGPIALIEDGTPVIVLAPEDGLVQKTVSNLREVASRGARVVVVGAPDGAAAGSGVWQTFPLDGLAGRFSAIPMSIPLQLFAYHFAVARGLDVDRPRNLAKSVTVE